MTDQKPQNRYIDLATARFAAHGFHGTSLAALAGDAGVSKQALLHFFGSKERLYRAVLEDLAARLIAPLAAIPDAAAQDGLRAYFHDLIAASLRNDTDARLVIRALLDSPDTAQSWPLRAYLDRLVRLTRAVPGWENESDTAILVALYALIGALQYTCVSQRTLAGMYGRDIGNRLRTRQAEQLGTQVDLFLTPATAPTTAQV